MTWEYHQRTGTLLHDGVFQGSGYSGKDYGRNNPVMQDQRGYGPIPQGRYRIGPAYDDPHLGPCVMHLDPELGTETFGRDLFRIHGDNARHDASHGCVIIGPTLRRLVAGSGDHELLVTA